MSPSMRYHDATGAHVTAARLQTGLHGEQEIGDFGEDEEEKRNGEKNAKGIRRIMSLYPFSSNNHAAQTFSYSSFFCCCFCSSPRDTHKTHRHARTRMCLQACRPETRTHRQEVHMQTTSGRRAGISYRPAAAAESVGIPELHWHCTACVRPTTAEETVAVVQ